MPPKKDYVEPDLVEPSAQKKGRKTKLVTMTKGDRELAVNPTCVAAHEKCGWVRK